MGAVKQLMLSLRLRFISPNSRSSHSSTESLSDVASTSSISTLPARPSSYIKARTPPITPIDPLSTPPIPAEHGLDTSHVEPARGVADKAERVQKVELGAHETLDLSIAMLNFIKTLPLKELGEIGYESTRQAKRDLSMQVRDARGVVPDKSSAPSAGTSDRLSLFACSKVRQLRRDCDGGPRANSNEKRMGQSPSMASSGESQTLSLSSTGYSEWSFVCRAAKQTEEDFAGHDCGSDISLGGLQDWKVTPAHGGVEIGEEQSKPVQYTRELDPTFIVHELKSYRSHGKNADQPVQDASNTAMSDEEFEALPDWSDVEDDPHYNQFEEESFCWSSTARSCPSIDSGAVFEMVYPAVHVPSGVSAVVTRDVSSSEKWW